MLDSFVLLGEYKALRKDSSMLHIFKFCNPYLLKYKGRIIVFIIICITVSLMSVLIPLITGSLVDVLIGQEDTRILQKYSLFLLLVCIVELVGTYFSQRLYTLLHIKCGIDLNAAAIKHIQRMPYTYMQGKDTAFVNQQVNNDALLLIIFCIKVLQDILFNVVVVVVPMLLMAKVKIELCLLLILIDAIYFFIYFKAKKTIYDSNYEMKDAQSVFFSRLDEQLDNVKFVQSQGISDRFIDRLTSGANQVLEASLKYQKKAYVFDGADIFVDAIARIAVFIIGGTAVINGQITIGLFTVVLSYFLMSTSATKYFFNLGREIQDNRVSCDRLECIFNEPIQSNGEIMLASVDSVECVNVSFSYSEKTIIENSNLVLEKDKIYVLLGGNGTGKSTLIDIILGLHKSEYEGDVLYNNMSIKDIDLDNVRKNCIGVSEQEPALLPETLKYNLFLDDEANFDEIVLNELMSVLKLDSYYNSLEMGFDTPINDSSSNLSGGEKQKISILRALLKNPSLLLLDEPTSALDKDSRKSLVDYLAKNKKNRITLISTHDKELLDISDCIIRIIDGEVGLEYKHNTVL